MKVSDLRAMTVLDLKKELNSVLRDQFNMRMQSSTGQLTRSHLIKNNKITIAQIKTILREKELIGNDNEHTDK